MKPVLFEIFSIPVYSYGVMVAIAFFVGYLLVLRQSKHLGFSPEQLGDFALILAVSGIIGARLLYVIIAWEYYSVHVWEVFNLRGGGLSFHGGAILATLSGIWYIRRHRLPLGKMADLVAPVFALGIAIVRLGCLLNGCCYGLPSNLPWAFDCSYLHDLPRHPTQLYESLAMFGVFAYLTFKGKHKHFPGYLLVLLAVLYSGIRFGVEFFRDVPQFWPPFSMAQAASILIVLIGIAVIIIKERSYLAEKKEYTG